jgi:putative flippase GtrA
MRPGRYEVLLWVLTLLLLLGPYIATLIAFNIAVTTAQSGDPCFSFENQQVPCPISDPVYGYLAQLAPALVGAGVVLVGVSLAVRVVITTVTLPMRAESTRVPETEQSSADYDLFRRPEPTGHD